MGVAHVLIRGAPKLFSTRIGTSQERSHECERGTHELSACATTYGRIMAEATAYPVTPKAIPYILSLPGTYPCK